MKITASRTVWATEFTIGGWPRAIECECHIVEAMGKRYIRTPWAMLDAHDDDATELQRLTTGDSRTGYYSTEKNARDYLYSEYPHAELAVSLMNAWACRVRNRGKMVGDADTARSFGCTIEELGKLCRGHRHYTRKQIKDVVKNAK